MFKKSVFIIIFAALSVTTAYANNKTVNYTLPSEQCKTFVGSWVGDKKFHFKTKGGDGGMLVVEDKSTTKLVLPKYSYIPNEGDVEYVGETYNGLGYDFTASQTTLTLTSPKYRQYKLKFCNAIW